LSDPVDEHEANKTVFALRPTCDSDLNFPAVIPFIDENRRLAD
jgi:hypothetical protein